MTSPRTLLGGWNLRAKKRWGQNFLKDPATAGRIVSLAGLGAGDRVLEIGAGLGALTLPLSGAVARVAAVEIDREMAELLRTELKTAGVENVTIVEADILKLDLNRWVDALGGSLVVVGNLPYNISSQVVVKLIGNRGLVERAVLMFQHEMARRLAAEPGSRDYGRLTVMLRYCADIRKLVDVPAERFFPRPAVDSEVLDIRFRPQRELSPEAEAFLFAVIKAAFGQRRKTLRNALAGSALQIDAPGAETALLQAGIDPARRAETLSVSEFLALGRALDGVLLRR